MNKNLSILKNYIIYFFFLLFIILYGCTHVKAETKTIYSSNTNGSLSGSNQYLYGYLTGGGTIGVSTGTVGSTITGKSYGFIFWYYESLSLSKTYEMTINFKSDDLVPNFSSNWVDIQSCANTSCNSNIIISVQKQSTSGYSTWLKIKFNSVSAGSYIKVTLGSENNDPLTGGASGGTTYFGISSVSLTSTNENQDIINNQTNNTNNIINNNNSNTQEIISNQNQNTEDMINSQKACYTSVIDSSYLDNSTSGFLQSNGNIRSYSGWRVSQYIDIFSATDLKMTSNTASTLTNTYACFYDTSYTLISCLEQRSFVKDTPISIPSGSHYFRFSYNINAEIPVFSYYVCKNGNQAITDSVNDLNNNLNNDDTSGATSEASDFFSDFNTNTFGLTSIITAPLNLIQSITSSTCSDLELPLPYLDNKKLILPCMSTIYSQYFGTFFTLYQTITYGIIAYWVCVRIFNLVKDFKNPEHDEIEVVDL